jgi:hypothetical protein
VICVRVPSRFKFIALTGAKACRGGRALSTREPHAWSAYTPQCSLCSFQWLVWHSLQQ